jgi:hypothetical protein
MQKLSCARVIAAGLGSRSLCDASAPHKWAYSITVKVSTMPALMWSFTWQCISHWPTLSGTMSTTSCVAGRRLTTSTLWPP